MVDCTNIATLKEVQDFSKDAKVLTEVVTSNADDTVQTDSTGKTHKTLSGLVARFNDAISESGWSSKGFWTDNPIIDEVNQYVRDNSTGFDYAPLTLPYTVDSVTNPDPETLVGTELRRVFEVNQVSLRLSEERSLGEGLNLYTGSNFSYVQDGDAVPTNTTHLSIIINGKVEDVAMSSVVSGVVSSLTETSAIIGTTPVTLHSFKNGGYQATDAQLQNITPLLGEQWFNTTTNNIHLGDGATQGGYVVSVKEIENVASLKSISFNAGEVISTKGYYLQNDGGQGDYIVKTQAQMTADGDPLDDVINIELSNGNWAVLIPVLNEINALQAGILNDGSDQWEKIYNLEAFVFQKPFDVFWPEGTYDVGIRNWPFRNTSLTPTSFRDYKNITLRGAGKSKTTFSTTSVDGADVLQLNAVEGITVKDLSVKATGTGSAAGSNGVSVTNGGKNIDIDIDCVDLFYVAKPTYVDGGKAFTLQNGVNTSLPYENIKIRGNATQCAFAVEISVTFDTFQTISGKNFKNVDIEVGAEDCWIGGSAGASEPTAVVDGADLGSDVRVVVNAVNCAKPLSIGRWCGGTFNANVLNTKNKSQLFRPSPSDQDVIAQTVIAAFYVNTEVTGVMKEADHKLKIGGGTNGSFGLSGATVKSKVRNSISVPFIVGDEVDVVDVGGNTTANCQINIGNVTDGTGIALFTATNFVTYNESLRANIESKSVKVKRDGQAWDTFRAESGSDSIGIARLGSGSAGVADGFATVIDTVTGTTYKIQLYT